MKWKSNSGIVVNNLKHCLKYCNFVLTNLEFNSFVTIDLKKFTELTTFLPIIKIFYF